jgi:hypothetical protein
LSVTSNFFSAKEASVRIRLRRQRRMV